MKQWPLQTRDYEDRNHQMQKYTSVGLTLSTGCDTLYAEVTGEDAVKLPQLDTNYLYCVNLSLRAREFNLQDGTPRCATDMYITKISAL